MKKINLLKASLLILAFVFSTIGNAFAIPALQIYVEESTYDTLTETWITDSNTFRLWVLGDPKGTDDDGDVLNNSIFGVFLAVAYNSSETGSISFTPTTADDSYLPSPGDNVAPSTPVFSASGSDSAPPYKDGTLPSHGIYGNGVSWTTYSIGNFTLTDSPIGDYINIVPNPAITSNFPDMGQINAYDVNVTGYSWVHFDAFDHVVANNGKIKYVKAPFSHDAEGGSDSPIPEPATLSLLGLGLVGLLGFRKKK